MAYKSILVGNTVKNSLFYSLWVSYHQKEAGYELFSSFWVKKVFSYLWQYMWPILTPPEVAGVVSQKFQKSIFGKKKLFPTF